MSLKSAENAVFKPNVPDAAELLLFGQILDHRPARVHGHSGAIELARKLLQVRTRSGVTGPLCANAAQKLFEAQRGTHNIVLKARQMGLTTWAAARFFLKTITRPGTLMLQVAHTQESAEEIFRIVHRFHDCLPDPLRTGYLRTSHANVRQIIFPELDCEILYSTCGSQAFGGLDRGRMLSAMDEEVMAMLQPFSTPKLNYTVQPATDMQTHVFWDEPTFAPINVQRDRLSRSVRVMVYSYQEQGE